VVLAWRPFLGGQFLYIYKRVGIPVCLTRYSYFNAVTGTSVAARSDGYSPESSPINVAKTSANSGSQGGV